ncbi:MAG: 2-methylaconitate cis-trans isomerase PrpF family protein, partial [Methylococcales bacterium]|nr:2-methylaconitate cis-trans isomerase PrpF family protein [Methylococcales bacterium]
GAPIRVEFFDPGSGSAVSVFPTGRAMDKLKIDSLGEIDASLVNVGNPTVFIDPAGLGLSGTEAVETINADNGLLETVELIRCHAAVAMGLTDHLTAAGAQPGTPKLAWVGPACDYRATDGREIVRKRMDISARIFSMGRLHHAFTGTGAVALVVAAMIPGTLVDRFLEHSCSDKGIRIGHAAGIMDADATVIQEGGSWICTKASLVRTARTLMRGEVLIAR